MKEQCPECGGVFSVTNHPNSYEGFVMTLEQQEQLETEDTWDKFSYGFCCNNYIKVIICPHCDKISRN